MKRVCRKKKNVEKLPMEYQKQTQEQIEELKQQWKTFLKIGCIVLAAGIALIVFCVAWFAANDQVGASGTGISATDCEFELAAAGTAGAYDRLLTVPGGVRVTADGKALDSTDGNHSSVTWVVSPDSNLKNDKENGGIEPGSSGSMTFYVISHIDGPLEVMLDLSLSGYKENGNSSGLEKITSPEVQQLLEGHILLFAGYDRTANSYECWISEDAEPWTMKDGTDQNISLSRKENGELEWKIDHAEAGKAYAVTLYWIWPEMLESYLMNAQTYTGKRPLLFPEDVSDSADSRQNVLPADLFETMCSTGGGSAFSNRYFLWEDGNDFGETVTPEVLSQLRRYFNPAVYRAAANYYDAADQYLGGNIQYVKLKLEAR